ncbi:hypothetical protein [Cohnella sp. GCM10012308]|uniref:hypothetical protein n=1 Tax=Cohnella sp. GCM10012308 TaxID=3317329 RepID=UPI00361235AA
MRADDRNFGCRIKRDLVYKGYEAVVMENEAFRLTVLPGKGTDLIELLHKPTDTDFAWFTRLGLRPKEAAFSDFQSQYEGGWQEILPNLGGRHVHRGAEMPAYGEAALSSWRYEIAEDGPMRIRVVFRLELRSLPLAIEKSIEMMSGEAGFRLEERLTNVSPAVIHADWGHHITFGEPFLVPGTLISLPDGDVSDASYELPAKGSPGGFGVLPAGAGRYALRRPDGIGAEVSWDAAVWPYLWFWRDHGGEASPPYFGSHYNVGLEMFSSPPAATLEDSIAAGTAVRLEPYGTVNASLAFRVLLP